jgi:PAS domain S-box-containing protein
MSGGRRINFRTAKEPSGGEPASGERWFSTLVANSSDLIAVLDDDARVMYANPAAERVLGFVPGTQMGRNMLDLVHPDDRDATMSIIFQSAHEPRINRPAVFRYQTASRGWRFLEATWTNCMEDPAIGGIVLTARDVTERTNLTRALRTLSHVNQVLVHATEEGSLLNDICNAIVDSGGYPLAWVGYLEDGETHTVRPIASAGRTEYLDRIRVRWWDDDDGDARGPTATAIRTRTVQVLENSDHSSSSTPRPASAHEHEFRTSCVLPITVGDETIGALTIYAGEPGALDSVEVTVLQELAGDLAYGIGRLRDADRLTRNESLLREAERLAKVGHWEWDLVTGRFEFLADEMCVIYGVKTGEWDGTIETFFEFTLPEDRAAVERAIEQTLTEGTAELQHRIVRPDGEVRFVHKRAEAIYGSEGKPIRVIGASMDITEQKNAERQLEDSRQFLATIAHNMAEGMVATDHEGIVTFANTAAEKLLGWEKGDLIGEPCHAAFDVLRPDGTFKPEEDCALWDVFVSGQVVHNDHDVFIRRDGSSVPVAYTASPLLTDNVRGAVVVFDDITEREAEVLRIERELEKLSWVGRIRDALDQDRFVLYSQPIVDLTTNEVVQNELLIRMLSPEGDVVEPDRFLPTAEEFGLISEIDRWVVGETARLAGQGNPVEFNLSAKSVADPHMLAIVRNALETHGVSPELVVCELTETALVRDTPAAEAFVTGLNNMGCRVALDDFGAGYGGFAYLKSLPVSYLKIDQQFVTDLPNEESSRHVVSAVVNLARAFSMKTVAEGAEDDVTLEILKELGVDFAQGFVIARPGPVSDMLGKRSCRSL